MHYYTNAPVELDFSNTREIEPRVGRINDMTGDVVRLVDIEKSSVGAQTLRYKITFHSVLTSEEFALALSAGHLYLVNPVNYIYVYTDASADYDYHHMTVEVHPCMAYTQRKHAPVRLVLIDRERENFQCGRYGSGLHMSLHRLEFEQELSNTRHGLVVDLLTPAPGHTHIS